MSGFDAIVIGSGIGGALAAWPLVHAGWRVLMLERGGWVERGPHNWDTEGVKELTPHYDLSTPYRVRGESRGAAGSVHCVGGASVFYGGVSLRLREADFVPSADEAQAGACWPFGYAELEPYYAAAERILGVAGEAGSDPIEPWRSTPYDHALPPLSRTSGAIAAAAARLGYAPFRLPLAINFGAGRGSAGCIRCHSCDCYACAISAKNDVATAVLPGLLARGMCLVPHASVVRLRLCGRRVAGVEVVDTRTGARSVHSAGIVLMAAGALATPHLLLASGLENLNPAGDVVGRMLMRHCNAIVLGLFPRPIDPAREFHKQVGINDLYFGHRTVRQPAGRLGTLQQVHSPPEGLVLHGLRGPAARLRNDMLQRMTGMIAIAADAPQRENRVTLDERTTALGMPGATVQHRHSWRDRAARAALTSAARAVLREAGALVTIIRPITTFSHALGTVRMGDDPATAPVDESGAFRGVDNLIIADASVLPGGGGVNPSLTIAATALRAGVRLTGSPLPGIPARGAASVRITRIAERAHV
jgi:choline dehydrogenase-like flavoprotein